MDARQGKDLKDTIYENMKYFTPSKITDCNSPTTNGFYYADSNTSNSPSGFYGFILHFVIGGMIVQLAISGVGNALYTRRYINTTSAWSDWKVY